MAPFIALIVSFVLFRVLGLFGLTPFDGWQPSLQAAAAVMLLLTASAHWGKRRADLIRMVPPSFRQPGLIVTLTGLLEIAGAVGLLFPATSRTASWCLAALLIIMFPANVHAARKKLTIAGSPVPGLPVRTLLQLVFIAVVLLAG